MLNLDEVHTEFANFLATDPAGRFRMDAALAHVAQFAYAKGLNDGGEDTERLNWLESNPRHAQTRLADGQVTDCVFYGISCAELMKLRDAIDAAMKTES